MSRLKDIMRGELVGARCRILESNDASQVGKDGIIMDETRDTFALFQGYEPPFENCSRIEENLRTIPKKGTVGEVIPSGKDTGGRIDFSQMTFRPEDRIKRLRR